jgi:hypothetical protein
LQLSPEQIAAAEACGVTFLPATPAQVQRLAMQRKVFYAGGQPVLATRGGGFFETVGTLQRVIEEGLQQQRDLVVWQDSTAPEVTEVVPAAAPAEADPSLPAEPAEVEAHAGTAAEPVQTMDSAPRPKRTRRSRPMVTTANLWLAEADEEPMAAPEPSPLPHIGRTAGGAAARPARPARRGPRWMVAGAARRGRADKHWSTRQR